VAGQGKYIKALSEEQVSSNVAYRGNFLTLRKDIAKLPDGSLHSREYVSHPGAAAIAAVFDDERIVIVRQFRYPMGEVYVEIPAGKIDAGETSLQTAKRELTEETGYRAAKWAYLTSIHPAIGFASECIRIYLARGLTAGIAQPDEGELLQVEAVQFGWLMDEIRAHRLPDVKTQIAAHWLDGFFSGRADWPDDLSAKPENV
jgi:ADP-ribose pyrophosphatase